VDPLGISVHFMTGEWDSGDVIASARLPVVDGLPAVQIQQHLSLRLCDLLGETLVRIPDDIVPQPQDRREASYFSFPEVADFEVRTDWSARRIFNFMRSTEHWGRAYPCIEHGRRYELKHALLFSERTKDHFLPRNHEVIHLECNPGVVVASYYH
jgi:methionyl-tRNA formyltransferase